MLELDLTHADVVRPLLDARPGRGHRPFVDAVLEGIQPGVVLVDDAQTPRAAIVGNASGFFFAYGDPAGVDRPALVAALLGQYLPREPTGLWTMSSAWQIALAPLLPPAPDRDAYHWRGPLPDAPRLPSGFALRPLDARLAVWDEGLDSWVARIWGGPTALAERVGGFVVAEGERVVSFCTACALCPGEVEIEIGTVPDRRGQGLATIAAVAWIEAILASGRLPAWTCSAENEPSAALARKLSFVWRERVPGFVLGRREA